MGAGDVTEAQQGWGAYGEIPNADTAEAQQVGDESKQRRNDAQEFCGQLYGPILVRHHQNEQA